MSRHRNVRHLIAEDDYYDAYDDDDYDDYDDDYYQPKTATTASAKTKKQPAKKQQGKAVPATPSKSTPSTNTASKTPQQQQPQSLPQVVKPQPPAQKQTAAAAGVTQPPPGWGKPTTAAAAGVTKPPPGWGKPMPSNTAAAAGITKPPPGWGKPTSPGMDAKATKSDNNSQPTPSKQQQQSSSSSSSKPVPPILQEEAAKGRESQLSMVVLGHVDAGKSTMMGQLLFQIGQVTKRQAIKVSGDINVNNNNASNSNIQWAWLLDEDDAERSRGVTMNIATKTFATPHHPRVVILDAPGHADFVPTMITGAANADVALLVIDASADHSFTTAFKHGQTKEHILLARGLGVSQLVVCVNKLDVRDWSPAVFQTIKDQLLPFLTGQANFGPKRIRFVPTSGLTGVNIMPPNKKNASEGGLDEKLRVWYKGPTLYEAIDSFQSPKHSSYDEPLRIILTDVYSDGKGVGARGRVVQGFLETGERVVVLPIGDDTTVGGLNHMHPLPPDAPVQRSNYAVAGETVDLTLTGIDAMRVSTGSLLSRPSLPDRPPVRKKCRAKLVVMDDLSVPIIRGAQALFHIHSLDIPAVLTNLISMTSRATNQTRDRPRALTSGSSAVVEILLSEKICIEPFNQCRALGRFVLRRGGDTIAVGIIEEVL